MRKRNPEKVETGGSNLPGLDSKTQSSDSEGSNKPNSTRQRARRKSADFQHFMGNVLTPALREEDRREAAASDWWDDLSAKNKVAIFVLFRAKTARAS